MHAHLVPRVGDSVETCAEAVPATWGSHYHAIALPSCAPHRPARARSAERAREWLCPGNTCALAPDATGGPRPVYRASATREAQSG